MILRVSIFLKKVILQSKHKKKAKCIIFYNNDKCFLVLVIYMFVMFYFFFHQKAEKKSKWPKFSNIIFLFLLKVASVGLQTNKLTLPCLKNLFVITFISPSFTRVFFNWNITNSPYLQMLLIKLIKFDKTVVLIFSHWSQCSMLILVICGGFNSRRFSCSNIFIVLSPYC